MITEMNKYIEYQEYMKNITDKFISRLIYNSAEPIENCYTPKYKMTNGKIEFIDYSVDENFNLHFTIDECPTEMDGVIRRPKYVVEAWRIIENEYAVKWLNKNTITYEDWLKKELESNGK